MDSGYGEQARVEFNRKIAACDGQKYLVSEAEQRDLKRIIEISCMHCGHVMAKDEVRVVPPSAVQQRDRYVIEGIVARRVLCRACYEKMVSSAREMVRIRYMQIADSLRKQFFKTLEEENAIKR